MNYIWTVYHILLPKAKKGSISASLKENRQRPILPGRVQPSTFGTEELNYCVRYGNRWDLSVITTGRFSRLACRYLLPFACSASFRPLPSLCSSSCFRPCTLRYTLTTAQIGFNTLDLTIDLFVSFFQLLLSFVRFRLQGLLYQALKSSPRPISINNLHVLPHFQR